MHYTPACIPGIPRPYVSVGLKWLQSAPQTSTTPKSSSALATAATTRGRFGLVNKFVNLKIRRLKLRYCANLTKYVSFKRRRLKLRLFALLNYFIAFFLYHYIGFAKCF
jgi:hypothetical protein